MKPIGKTYLIRCESERITKEGDIYVVNNVDTLTDIFWKGVVAGYGTLVDEKKDDVVPIGTKVVVDVTKKGREKIIIKNVKYVVRDIEDVIGVIEDE